MRISGKDLEKTYRGRKVVNGVNFDISQGEIVGLLGPNGAGKTTTFYMTVGLVKPTRGQIFFDDQDVSKWPMYKRARAGVGYLPQEPSVFRKLTVEDNLRLVLQLAHKSKSEADKKIQELADELHIGKILNSTGNVLSGGERRRVEIARALATEPKFILLDEPFAGVDLATEEIIFELLRREKALGKTIVIVFHDLHLARQMFDWLILLNRRLISCGPIDEVLQKEHLLAAFGKNCSLFEDAALLSKKTTPGLL